MSESVSLAPMCVTTNESRVWSLYYKSMVPTVPWQNICFSTDRLSCRHGERSPCEFVIFIRGQRLNTHFNSNSEFAHVLCAAVYVRTYVHYIIVVWHRFSRNNNNSNAAITIIVTAPRRVAVDKFFPFFFFSHIFRFVLFRFVFFLFFFFATGTHGGRVCVVAVRRDRPRRFAEEKKAQKAKWEREREKIAIKIKLCAYRTH